MQYKYTNRRMNLQKTCHCNLRWYEPTSYCWCASIRTRRLKYYLGLSRSVRVTFLYACAICLASLTIDTRTKEKMGRSAISFKLLAGLFTVLWGTVTVLRLILVIVMHPIRSFQRSKRDVPPACLTDPALGRHEYITANGIKFHCVTLGERSKPLMLLLHGFPEVSKVGLKGYIDLASISLSSLKFNTKLYM